MIPGRGCRVDLSRRAAHALDASRRRSRGLRAEAGALLQLEGHAVVFPEQTQVSEGGRKRRKEQGWEEVGSKGLLLIGAAQHRVVRDNGYHKIGDKKC